ncbi:hypothetical protein GIB67_039050 [Kingdonia uniflora]|uniref:RNase H type-1 domain-containing protein n=1 Tax=Kingdonia uniflora TaxID=39325 RepID=A0A7J7LKV3_9MAGN|nr:hypothetical protein GIB67_039050 [Kingdonia uniflora]
MARPHVTITLGRTGQVVKRSSGIGITDSSRLSEVSLSGRKRSIMERLGNSTDDTVCQRNDPMRKCDGSCNNNIGGIAAIIRDYKGIPTRAAAGKSNSTSVIMLELLAMEMGFKLTLKLNIRKICLCSDSQIAVTYINKQEDTPWRFKHVISRIVALIRKLDHFEVRHIFRETIAAADHLAGSNSDEELVESMPNSFTLEQEAIIADDARGKIYERMP